MTTSIGVRLSPGFPPIVPRIPDIDFIRVIEFINDLCVQVENTNTKRKTIIAVRRFKPNSNGYKLTRIRRAGSHQNH